MLASQLSIINKAQLQQRFSRICNKPQGRLYFRNPIASAKGLACSPNIGSFGAGVFRVNFPPGKKRKTAQASKYSAVQKALILKQCADGGADAGIFARPGPAR